MQISQRIGGAANPGPQPDGYRAVARPAGEAQALLRHEVASLKLFSSLLIEDRPYHRVNLGA